MGYRTYYTVTDLDGNDLSEELSMFLHETEDYAEDYSGDNETSWYEYEEDLKSFSLESPGRVIVCHGIGENNGDIWDLYVKDGKTQRCEAEIIIPPYDESKLV